MKLNSKTNRKLKIDEIIYKVTKANISFEKLSNQDKKNVLFLASKSNPKLKVFGTKWYDFSKRTFFVKEYSYDRFFDCVNKRIIEFKTFSSFFNYCKGDIYSDSCFSGYSFSKAEIEKYNIDLSLINFDSLIDYTIDDQTFEKLVSIKKAKQKEALQRKDKIINFIKKCDIDSFENLVYKLKEWRTEFVAFDGLTNELFFYLIIKKYGNSIKELLIEFVCHMDITEGITFDDILLFFGEEAALKVINSFDGDCSYSTKKRRIKFFKKWLEAYKENNFTVKKGGYYSTNTGFYILFEEYFYPDGSLLLERKHFFESFDGLVSFLSGDLSNYNFSDAPIENNKIEKFITSSNTIFPIVYEYTKYTIRKYFYDGMYCVVQRWQDSGDNVVLEHKESFENLFDFVHYLKKDLSNADLLMSDELSILKDDKSINWSGAKIKGADAKEFGIKQASYVKENQKLVEFKATEQYEISTTKTYELRKKDFDDEEDELVGVSYISDVHLLHRFDAYNCQTQNDTEYVVRKIADTIATQATDVCLVGGDLSSDYDTYKKFIKYLKATDKTTNYFFVLGNHELWPFDGKELADIFGEYRSNFENNIHLVQNNIFYYKDREIFEINEEELSSISINDLRAKTRDAEYLVFGGIGFSGRNEQFNANNGIYMSVLDREREIKESEKFYTLYKKICVALKDKNVIVLTHMPKDDWCDDDIFVDGFIYVSGHNHRNFFYDDGIKRYYADNQVGYKGKNVSLKYINTEFGFDWFADYNEGIHEITREDYLKFYRGIGEYISFNKDFEKLYLIKKDGIYIFLMLQNGVLYLLSGGIQKKTEHTLQYFLDNLSNYTSSIKLFLSSYDEYQKNISKEIKSIGGDGEIHGCIVDIDFYNHLYINPLDGKITPYFAYSMVDKFVYKNIPSLLKNNCPYIYEKMVKKLKKKTNKGNYLVLKNNNQQITDKNQYVNSTEMYKISRIIKSLQFTTKYNVVRLWSDAFASVPTIENGKAIVSHFIDFKKDQN